VSSPWMLVGGCAVVTVAIKAAGPVAFGGRELPHWFTRISTLLAPALLAALLTTQALTRGHHIRVGANDVGLAAAAVVLWRTESVPWTVFTAAVVTAVVRALT
jgi:branched-subunit amino acid transport protein